MIGKKAASICIIIIGMIVVLPFNYMYGIGGFEVDAVWAIVGIVMIAFWFLFIKKFSETETNLNSLTNKFRSILCAIKVQVTV